MKFTLSKPITVHPAGESPKEISEIELNEDGLSRLILNVGLPFTRIVTGSEAEGIKHVEIRWNIGLFRQYLRAMTGLNDIELEKVAPTDLVLLQGELVVMLTPM